jgi:hypothetical protein
MARRILETATDGVHYVEYNGSEFRHVRVQNTDPYYAQNQESRKVIGKAAVTRKGSWSLPIGNIPFADYQQLVKANPDLRSTDPQIATAAWLKLLRSPLGERLRTVNKNLIPDSMSPDKGSILPIKEQNSDG